MTARVSVVDPLVDSRWDDLLGRHPRASVFHSRGWLEALKRTYGYEPIVLTTTARGPMENGLALCRVRAWTSRRLVSLPFSDHCDPLFDRPDDLSDVLGWLSEELRKKNSRSLDLRPRSVVPGGLAKDGIYCLHTLDLRPSSEQIFDGFHPSCTRRAIRRAEREGLRYEAGTSDRLVSSFYQLLRQARRRHGLPPQPLDWFRNLIACVGNGLAIHVASKDSLPVAGILTVSFKRTMVYKYGGSDARHHRLGSMPFLFWRAIQGAKAQGIEEMDLGRSALDQSGLIAFKDHLGAVGTTLTYYSSKPRRPGKAHAGPLARVVRRIVPYLPDAALDFTGRLLYKHLG